MDDRVTLASVLIIGGTNDQSVADLKLVNNVEQERSVVLRFANARNGAAVRRITREATVPAEFKACDGVRPK